MTAARSPKSKRRKRQLARFVLFRSKLLRKYATHHGSAMGKDGGGKGGRRMEPTAYVRAYPRARLESVGSELATSLEHGEKCG